MIIGGSEVGTGGTWTPCILPLLRPSWMQLDRSLYACQDIISEGGFTSNSLWRPSPPYPLFVCVETWLSTLVDRLRWSSGSENLEDDESPIHWDRYNSASFQKQMLDNGMTYKSPYCKPGRRQKFYVIVIKLKRKLSATKGRESMCKK